ncbi:glycine hydroxymethyltransferase [Planosporangium mesophilum]|uniref:Serine hydroxymethyltransferase n=1 Tax=Planosporangium mesophilum TaxID=689768 RepID=A0A8J3X211_9ACTN|nr:glycine hydroxymethyltransferase [Planosporangium mesophilum]NJC82628.1 glycine hydroxymethyltransferase [Planosporangium mesophilum]GII24995.1 serine hydroxymethyltransferase [Planosporangium mesophilum]
MTQSDALRRYLSSTEPAGVDAGAAAFYASLDVVSRVSPAVAASIAQELRDQRSHLKLIASENFSSLAVQLAQGNLFTDKYAEGYAGHRFYAGCDNVDAIESEASELGRELFGADHVYVQPHSGADANLVAFLAILATTVESPALERLGEKNPAKIGHADWEVLRREFLGQRLLGMDYYSGGHLTHGYRHNVSARLFEAHSYTVDPETKLLDFDQIRARALEVRPRILLAGYSAYPRKINFARMRELADEIGATFMVDMAHFAGLVAGKVFTGDHDPVKHAHVVTTTTHKTLRGPRGGMILSTPEYASAIDKGCPMVLGGPLPHAMAAKAVALREALDPGFRDYAHAVVDNAQALADALQWRGARVLTGGTDNHIVLVDVAESYGLTGRQAESALRSCGLTLNRNSLPFDANGPWYTSGLRLGTPAVTTLGMGTDEVTEIADVITSVLSQTKPAADDKGGTSKAKFNLSESVVDGARKRVADLLAKHPLYPEIDLDIVDPA